MGGQKPGEVQRATDPSTEKKMTIKQGDGLVYSFVTGEGPGEGSLKQMEDNLQMVPQQEFLASIRNAKMAEATIGTEPKKEIDMQKYAADGEQNPQPTPSSPGISQVPDSQKSTEVATRPDNATNDYRKDLGNGASPTSGAAPGYSSEDKQQESGGLNKAGNDQSQSPQAVGNQQNNEQARGVAGSTSPQSKQQQQDASSVNASPGEDVSRFTFQGNQEAGSASDNRQTFNAKTEQAAKSNGTPNQSSSPEQRPSKQKEGKAVQEESQSVVSNTPMKAAQSPITDAASPHPEGMSPQAEAATQQAASNKDLQGSKSPQATNREAIEGSSAKGGSHRRNLTDAGKVQQDQKPDEALDKVNNDAAPEDPQEVLQGPSSPNAVSQNKQTSQRAFQSSAKKTTATETKEEEAQEAPVDANVKSKRRGGPPKIVRTDENGRFVEVDEETGEPIAQPEQQEGSPAGPGQGRGRSAKKVAFADESCENIDGERGALDVNASAAASKRTRSSTRSQGSDKSSKSIKVEPVKKGKQQIETGALDQREMKFVTLPNKMRCILISDPNADESAASLQVKIGSFSDPQEWRGTAVYLQQMLIQASKKYPKPGQTEQFFAMNKGEINSFTNWTCTNYHFQVQHRAFEEALDRFANVFLNPLFPESESAKAIKKCHHQMKSALFSDFWHHTNLYLQLSHAQSPIHKYTFGNKEQLSMPGARKAMMDFFQTYYSANLMTLVVSSNLSLQELEKMVTGKFKGIKDKKVDLPDYSRPPPYNKSNSCHLVKMVPVVDADEMKIVWNLPYYGNEINKIHYKYFMELFGQEGPNSILSYLKYYGYATYLQVGKHSIGYCLTKFEVTIELTEKGLQNYDHVVAAVFQYAQNIRDAGPIYGFCNELNQMGKLRFDYPNRTTPMQSCIKLSKKLASVPDQDIHQIVRHRYVRDALDVKLLMSLSEMFCNPQRMNIYLHSKSFRDECIIQEDFMMTKFFVEEIPEELLAVIRQPSLKATQKRAKLSLPEQNHLIPQNIEIKDLNPDFCGEPKQISIWKDTDVWFKQDHPIIHQPKGIIQLRLYTSDLQFGGNTVTTVFAHLWQRLLMQSQHEYLYTASKAGMLMDVEINADDISILWKGFNDSLSDFVLETTKNMVGIASLKYNQRKQMFEVAKNELLKEWRSSQQGPPYRQSLHIFAKVMQERAPRDAELSQILSKYTFDQFEDSLNQWLKTGTTVWFLHGNFFDDEALDIVAKARKTLKLSDVSFDTIQRARTLKLQPGTALLYEQPILDKAAQHDSYMSYYQFGVPQNAGDLKTAVCNTLVHTFLAVPFREQLKMDKNFSKVAMRESLVGDTLGMWFLTMSDKKSSEYQCAQINEFLLKARQSIQYFNDHQFQDLKNVLSEALQQKSKDLEQENERLWKEITTCQFMHDRPEQCCNVLAQVTKQEMVAHFELMFFDAASCRLDIALACQKHNKDRNEMLEQNNASELFSQQLKRTVHQEEFLQFQSKLSYSDDNMKAAMSLYREQHQQELS